MASILVSGHTTTTVPNGVTATLVNGKDDHLHTDGVDAPVPLTLELPNIFATLLPSTPLSEEESSKIAQEWLDKLSAILQTGAAPSTDELSSVLAHSIVPWWKDHLSLTWALRCAHGIPNITNLLAPVIPLRKPVAPALTKAIYIPMTGTLQFVQAQFDFETPLAKCKGVACLIPEQGVEEGDVAWRAWVVMTQMADLKGHEADAQRLKVPDEGGEEQEEVDVLIIGAGQSGLQLAAALRTLSFRALIVDRVTHVGDHWKRVYESFKLHLSKYYCQLAYLPWPESTPFFPKISDIANFLDQYAHELHLNVLLESEVKKAEFDKKKGSWNVPIRTGGTERTVRAEHLVFATGLSGYTPAMPNVPGKEIFKGEVMHSLDYRAGEKYKDKHAIVVGTACSGHDIAADLYRSGAASVTMIQRKATMVFAEKAFRAATGVMYNENGPPLEYADRLSEVMPNQLTKLLMAQYPPTEEYVVIEAGLEKRGFRLLERDLGHIIFERQGGHYLDVGCSQLIVDGKIGVKSGVPIKNFTESALAFEDGTELPADVIVFATGHNTLTMKEGIHKVVGAESAKGLKDIWGLDKEGHVKGVYRDNGVQNLWAAAGPFSFTRYNSKLLAMQIVASHFGLLQDRFDV
ncbi:FAD/NADP-binding domain-containing protein [Dacryopinax primogenitus]|uniref:FAD/NADP-binding domain-containing protein n=1 Tax=Dacryopinax primogenitus (strain DJM 731) TaxID=1858805 RepID=M5G5F5_DACPD|nr:FAD/NADP-binding domain-containing protein [Dacryopinax primogenitus]EJU03919.1 FAD/NADP-binding domain-containing protein [Dacryopinax primogenitus]